MRVFQFDSYTDALLHVFHDQKKKQAQLTLSSLSKLCLMQPSYLTNVLKGRSDLNSDQLYRICEQLELSLSEYEYLLLLLELKRTQYTKKRASLIEKIRALRSENLRAEKNLSVATVQLTPLQLEKYYLDPYHQLVHIYLTIPKAPKTLESLAKKFSISETRMQQVLDVLIEINFVVKKGKAFEAREGGKHLPRESPLLKPHQQLLRLKSLEQMQSLPQESVYSFSATISTSPEVRTKLQAEFLKFLKVAEKLVKSHEPEHLYQINFDLFPWEKESS